MSPQQKLFKLLDDKFVRAPFNNSWWMGRGYVCLQRVGKRFLVHDLWIAGRFRGMGHGRKMLNTVLFMSDKAGVELFIYAQPFDSRPTKGDGLTKHELNNWYERAGFNKYSAKYCLRKKHETR